MEEKKKTRKRTSGLIRDKERTMQKMIDAVKIVLLNDGYAGLNASAIAKQAGVDKRLVWTYFGSLDNLVETYISQRDNLKLTAQTTVSTINKKINASNLNELLNQRLENILNDTELQRIIQWQISENKDFLSKIAIDQEKVVENILKNIHNKTNINDVKATLALVVGGMHYLTLYSATNSSNYFGINIFEDHDLQLIKKSLKNIISMSLENN